MISIILPTWNEEGNIGILIESISSKLSDRSYEIIVIDADSKDKTVEVAKSFVSKGLPVRILVSSARKGLAYDTYLAMQYAKYNLIAVMDTDLQHDPVYLPSLIEKIENNSKLEMVIGSRYATGGSLGDWSIIRKIISFFAVGVTKFITGVNDPITQYYIVRKSVIEKLKLTPVGMRLSLYVISNCQNIFEIPITFKSRIHGETTQSFSRFKTDLLFVLKLFSLRVRRLLGMNSELTQTSESKLDLSCIKEV